MSKQWLDIVQADGVHPLSLADSMSDLEVYSNATVVQLTDMSPFAIYEVTGADASSFLQGQFCNDLAMATPTQAQITGYCTPKGRLLALPVILGFDGGYRLLVPHEVAEGFIKRLTMFIMRSDVAVKRLDDWVALGVTAESDNLAGPVADLLGALPEGVMSMSTEQNSQLVRWHDCYASGRPRARYLRIAPVEQQLTFWRACEGCGRQSSYAWRLADISAGIPSITQGVVESFVPQMVNLQLINGLSFTKGCYPGQEIVARMQYLGKLKRHMRIFRTKLASQDDDINELLNPGTELSAGSDSNAGVIVDAMPLSSSEALILAVTKVTANDEGFSLGAMALEAFDMPYELPSLNVA